MTDIQIGVVVIIVAIVAILLFAEHVFHGNLAQTLKRKPRVKK